MIPAIRGQLHACRRKAGSQYNLIGGFAVMGTGVGVGGGTYAATGRDVRAIKQVAPMAVARGLFAVAGNNAIMDGPGSKDLAPSTGVFALTGNAAANAVRMPAANPAGQSLGLLLAIPLTNTSTFALTGNSAKMTAGPGAGRIALTGNNAVMGAATGLGAASFSMFSTPARLNRGNSLGGASGTYALTNNAIGLNVKLPLRSGTFAQTGNTANAHTGHNLPSATGAFTLTGRAATMVPGTHGIGAGAGTFALTGYALVGGTGGAPLGLLLPITAPFVGGGFALNTPLVSGAFSLTGRAAALSYGRSTHVSAGTYSLTGNAAALSRRLILNSGTFALTGRAATMGDALGAGSGTFALTGRATAMKVELNPVTGSFVLTGNTAALSGQTVTLNPSDKSADITLSNGNLSFTGTNSPGHNYNVRGTQAGAAGRYFEVTYSTIIADFNTPAVGVANLSQSLSAYPGDPNAAAWFGSDYAEWPGSGYTNHWSQFSANDVLGVYRRASTVEFFKNGAIVGTATSLPSGALYPIMSLAVNSEAGTVNFGATALSYLPLGATSWDGSQTNTDTGAHSGAFVLTGRTAVFGEGLPAGSGTFTLTGRAAVMGESLGATGIGNYAVTGNAAAMTAGIPASSGSFAMTGRAAVIARGHGLAANSGSFVMTGANVSFAAPNSMNLSDAGPPGELTFSNSNKTVTHTSSDNTFAAVRALRGWSAGKHYAEIYIDNYGSGNQLGIGLLDGSATRPDASTWGNSSDGLGFFANGWAGYNAQWVQISSGIASTQTIMVAYDADLKRAYFGINGTWLNSASPSAGTGYIDMSSPGPSGAVYLSMALGQSDVMTARFTSGLAYTPPTGFSSG